MFQVTFLPDHKVTECEPGTNLLQAAAKAGVLIEGSCNGLGKCQRCKVKISGQEKLACQVFVDGDLVVETKSFSDVDRKKSLNELPDFFVPDPPVKKKFIKLPKGTLEKPLSLVEMIGIELGIPDLKADYETLVKLPEIIAAGQRKVTVIYEEDHLLGLEAGDTAECLYGMAFDIGTTTIVGILWDLQENRMVGSAAGTNPQSIYGADVISRIQYATESEDHLKELSHMVTDCLNGIIESLCEKYSVLREEIYDVTAVGNTTMSHLLLGISPKSLSRVPFTPVFREAVCLKAAELSLSVNPVAAMYVLPNIAGHVGSDLTGVLLYTKLPSLKGISLVIDIGTNGEIFLAKDGKILTCSTAAGPAFEGVALKCGMRAALGAIEKVTITDDVRFSVIGDKKAVGICGSGVIDLISEMLKAGLILPNGKLLTREEAAAAGISPKLSERLTGKGREKAFVIEKSDGEDPVVLTQADIREIQLAKGAVYGGIRTLMKKFGITESGIDRMMIAGAFGSYIDKNSAMNMGLLPKISEAKVMSVGNGAGAGASMALLSGKARKEAGEETKKVIHVDLSKDQDFEILYIESMNF